MDHLIWIRDHFDWFFATVGGGILTLLLIAWRFGKKYQTNEERLTEAEGAIRNLALGFQKYLGDYDVLDKKTIRLELILEQLKDHKREILESIDKMSASLTHRLDSGLESIQIEVRSLRTRVEDTAISSRATQVRVDDIERRVGNLEEKANGRS